MEFLYRYLYYVLWLSWMVYWRTSASSASAPKRVQRPGQRLLYVVEMLAVYSLLGLPRLWGYALSRPLIPWSVDLFWIGAVLVAGGLGFSCWARVHLGKHWSGLVTLKHGHELIRTGPYRLVRHPIYTGLILAIIGTAVAVDAWRGVLAVALCIESFVRKLRAEERWLTEEFGEEYLRYRREVKALVPGIV
jgi:protein-S-isoprenylcysteine O-methyltransferase Ste14